MNNVRTNRMAGLMLAMGMVSCNLVAEETTKKAEAVKAEPSVNEIEVGFSYLSDDAYRFGRFNGMTDDGAYIIGDVRAKAHTENGDFWRLRGTNLGLDSQYLMFQAGTQGAHSLSLEYDQLPDYENDTGVTPFLGAGGTHLRLPAGYDPDTAVFDISDPKNFTSELPADLDRFLLPFDQETERKRLKLGARLFFKSRWELDGSFQQETKRGTDWIGSSMGPAEEEAIMLKTTGALLPEPVDFETNKMHAALRYHGKQTQWDFSYRGSLFSNKDDSLTWQDPFDLDRTGRLALEPDNQMHQLSAAVGHTLSATNRLTGLLSVSRLTQDDDFLPFNTSTSVDDLPRRSLDGEVWLYKGQVKLTSRPMPKLRLSAKYDYDERDNNTPTATYYYYIADGIPGELPNKAWPKDNDPLSYQRHQFNLSANYRFNTKMGLRGGYKYQQIDRDSEDQERETTREQSLTLKWSLRALEELEVDVYGEHTRRRGSTYETRRDENPAMRTFYLADVDRNKLGASFYYMPTSRLSLGLTGEYLDDDYTDSALGLTEAEQVSLLLDASYQISERISSHAFYTHEAFKSSNAGAQDKFLTTPDWSAELEDTIDSAGLGFNFNQFLDRWDLGADLVYTRSRGKIHMINNTINPSSGDSIADPDDPTQQFPDLETSLTSLQLWTRYRYSDTISYRFSYWYEDFSSEDWTVDDLEADSVDHLLLLGEDRLDYTQHVVGLSVNVRF
ncbi:MAG: MtrB/PioB family decaheme-associated outer membrane protein [Gammaproteobacteria bacterium]|nr:MtrB/PioB family decaheme-associated outer membrane protein [Gammaproteobacteria bacterium]